jgi:O-antigen ligase
MVFGGLLMTALLIQVGFLMRKPRDLLLWAGVLLNGSAIVFTETRGAWIGFFAGFLILGWRFNRKWIGVGIALLVAGYFALPSNIQERIRSITHVGIGYNEKHEVKYSEQTRILIWASGMRMIRDYPLGIGQGNVGEIYPRYRLEAIGQYEATEPHLHNNFLQITVQNGWLGLVIYLSWIFVFFLKAFKFQGWEPLEQDLNWIMTCCFLASLVWGLTEYTFAQQFMYLQFSLLGLQWGLWKREKEASSKA